MINKEATAARRWRLNEFFQQVGKIMFPNEWDDTEAVSLLKLQANKTSGEKLRAAQKRGSEVDEQVGEQLLAGYIKIVVDLEALVRLIPSAYKVEKAQNAELDLKYQDECKRLNKPIDYLKMPSATSRFFVSGESEVFDSLEDLIGTLNERNYYELKSDGIEVDRINWSAGDISVSRYAIDAEWGFLNCSTKEIVPDELENLKAYILNPSQALSLFTPHETSSSNAKQITPLKHDWSEICGLMWRCLAVEKPPSDDFALQTRLKNTVTDDLEQNDCNYPPPFSARGSGRFG